MRQFVLALSGGLRYATTTGYYLAAFQAAIDRGVEVVRKLDAIVKNKYANNPAVLAEWTSASHTERAPKRKKETDEASGTGGGSGTPSGSSTPTP